MPKEQFVINNFKGMASAYSGTTHPVFLENVRVDVPDNVLVPENTDEIVYQYDGMSFGNPAIMQEEMYVDGIRHKLSVSADGTIKVGNIALDSVDTRKHPQINVIGRQAVIATGAGNAKFIRVGYPGKNNNLAFNTNEIIIEDDHIAETYLDFGSIRDIVMLNSENYLVLYKGSNTLTMYVKDDTTYRTAMLCDAEIIAIGYDVVAYQDDEDDWHGKVENIYYAYYDVSGLLKISIFKLSEAYPVAGTTPQEYNSSDPLSFDSDEFADEDRIGTYSVTITLLTDDIPNGYKLNSIAVTASRLFIGFNMPSGDSIAPITTETALEEDMDLLFAFALTEFLDDNTVSYGSATHPLYKSWLPWNPYKGCFLRYDVGAGAFNEGYGNNSVIECYIPHDTTLVGYADDSYNILGIADELFNTISGDFTRYIRAAQGSCGIICQELFPHCSLSVVDYANDIVGFLVEPHGYRIGIPLACASNEEDDISETDVDLSDGTGLFIINRTGLTCTATSASYYGNDTNSFPQNGMVLYCWNGKAMSSSYNGYKYNNFDISGDSPYSNYVTVKRCFDDSNTLPYSGYTASDYFGRFLLIPDSEESIVANGLRSSLIVETDSEAIRSILMFDTNIPELTVPYKSSDGTALNFAAGYNTIGIEEIKHYKDYESTTVETFESINRLNVDGGTEFISINDMAIENYDEVAIEDDLSTVAMTLADTTALISSLLAPEAITDGSDSFDADTVIRYKVSFTYDGTSSSPLSSSYTDFTDATEGGFDVQLTITISPDQLRSISKRLTAINIYAATVLSDSETELYRLVMSVPLTTRYFYKGEIDGTYIYKFIDTGSRLASFNANAGYSETVKTVSLARGTQCVCQNYLFVGRVLITSDTLIGVNTDNVVVRSLPFQPSVFNYQEDFVVLSFTPIALLSFNSRVYAFGSDRYSIINPDTMSIEHTSTSVGLEYPTHATSCDLGIFLFYHNNVYHMDGMRITAIGNEISTSSLVAQDLLPLSGLSTENLRIDYIQKRNAIVLASNYDFILEVFALGLDTKKWSHYTVKEENEDYEIYPVGMYKEDETVVLVTYDGERGNEAFKLFNGTETRDAQVRYIVDCGDSDQNKMIYDARLYDGDTPINGTVVIDDTLEPGVDSIKKKVFNLLVSFAYQISNIRLLIRRFVIK